MYSSSLFTKISTAPCLLEAVSSVFQWRDFHSPNAQNNSSGAADAEFECRNENPNLCFIPTASGDDQGYIDNFYKAFDSLNCKTSHINFF